ncbi:FlgO family outer membrane protein [Geomesophilobacter sediminis]|uniref:FlgO domain-containing protein n=1 Tax=Geomesophilobacter sediminis TaxID=2798584 RepID=A0A8J7M187_9BACT|nr:FlgO family outer membrane protein [Geomesophilobacter sediminis]MBJ6726782.1 hypothetical protein [Geomesophilobacter sediminis]
MRAKALVTVSLLVSLLSGCSSLHSGAGYGTKCPKDLDSQLKAIQAKQVFADLAQDLCGSRDSYGTVLVTDFVDLESLAPNASGILMGEWMRSSLSSVCGYDIQQAEFGRYFTLGANGLAVLTRRGEAIRKDEVKNADIVVGTFSQSADKLVLFAKKFNLNGNVITKMSSKEIVFSCTDWGTDYSVR